MKAISELLGFAVRSGLLWLILMFIPIAIWIAMIVARRIGRGSVGNIVGALVFLILCLVPFADEIAGRTYFSYLCADKAGVKVYQAVELGGEYWDERGKARFYDDGNGDFHMEGYRIKHKTKAYSFPFYIDHAGYERVSEKSGIVLGEVINFRYWGGWMRRKFSPNNTGTACDGEIERSNDLVKQVFVRKKS